jgi:hypothetical protein
VKTCVLRAEGITAAHEQNRRTLAERLNADIGTDEITRSDAFDLEHGNLVCLHERPIGVDEVIRRTLKDERIAVESPGLQVVGQRTTGAVECSYVERPAPEGCRLAAARARKGCKGLLTSVDREAVPGAEAAAETYLGCVVCARASAYGVEDAREKAMKRVEGKELRLSEIVRTAVGPIRTVALGRVLADIAEHFSPGRAQILRIAEERFAGKLYVIAVRARGLPTAGR